MVVAISIAKASPALQGTGFELLSLAIAHSKTLGFTALFLNAQSQATDFYRRAGFVPVGGEFQEADKPHQRNTSRAPADSADSRTALFSTWVMPEGTAMMILGLTNVRRLWTF